MSSISLLSQATRSQLGSSVAISTPVVLVKELLENAIDAGATAVDILISPNTLDKIEVRDNGRGIAVSDLDSLARHSHTSKLRSFEDLHILGGTTLGFRGQALASIHAVSELAVTTRTANVPVATAVGFLDHGGIAAWSHKSAPVGTTVTVTRLFAKMPVRARFLAKEAPKQIKKIKELLNSYALAWPQIRVCLKVFNNASLSWSYAPKPGAGVTEAALQLFGRDLVSQCHFRVAECSSEAPENADKSVDAQDGPQFTFEAFFRADPSKINRRGVFFAVDARPLSVEASTTKKLLSVYKSCLDRFAACNGVKSQLISPFIAVNIRCPVGSYDPNTEASKDDVVFADEHCLLVQFKDFLSAVYPYTVDAEPHEGSGSAGRGPELNPGIDPVLNPSQEPIRVDAPRSMGSASEARLLVIPSSPDSGAELDEMRLATQKGPVSVHDALAPVPRKVGMSATTYSFDSDEEDDEHGGCLTPATLVDAGSSRGEETRPNEARSVEGRNPWTLASMMAPRKPVAAMAQGPRPFSSRDDGVLNTQRSDCGEYLPIPRPLNWPVGELDVPRSIRHLDETLRDLSPSNLFGGAHQRDLPNLADSSPPVSPPENGAKIWGAESRSGPVASPTDKPRPRRRRMRHRVRDPLLQLDIDGRLSQTGISSSNPERHARRPRQSHGKSGHGQIRQPAHGHSEDISSSVADESIEDGSSSGEDSVRPEGGQGCRMSKRQASMQASIQACNGKTFRPHAIILPSKKTPHREGTQHPVHVLSINMGFVVGLWDRCSQYDSYVAAGSLGVGIGKNLDTWEVLGIDMQLRNLMAAFYGDMDGETCQVGLELDGLLGTKLAVSPESEAVGI